MVELKDRLSTSLCGVELDNPVIPASGTFGFGYEMAEVYDINILGSISFKGTTLNPRFGNPTPRIAECESGLINSVGLQNPGLEKVISEELPKLRNCFRKPLIANISGFSVDEYVQCCERMDKEEQVEILEVNISCPNVHNGGMAFGTSAHVIGTAKANELSQLTGAASSLSLVVAGLLTAVFMPVIAGVL